MLFGIFIELPRLTVRPYSDRVALSGFGISGLIQILPSACPPDHDDCRLGKFLYALLHRCRKVVPSASVYEIPQLVIDPDLLLLQGFF